MIRRIQEIFFDPRSTLSKSIFRFPIFTTKIDVSFRERTLVWNIHFNDELTINLMNILLKLSIDQIENSEEGSSFVKKILATFYSA